VFAAVKRLSTYSRAKRELDQSSIPTGLRLPILKRIVEAIKENTMLGKQSRKIGNRIGITNKE
jgi:hypothetical protein